MINMRIKRLSPIFFFISIGVALFLALAHNTPSPAQATRNPETKNEASNGIMAPSALSVQDLNSGLTPADLAEALVGSGVTISNISYTGSYTASGAFSGGSGIIGFDSGILLTSGSATNVVGPNISDGLSGANGQPGDTDLSELSGFTTYDAAVLEFDFVPTESTVFFQFVFASDEYNEFVNSSYNDVFAFFVNGTNCALVEGDPVTINTINYGNPYGDTPFSHPELYINNDTDDGGPTLDTEMDGLTKILTCSASVDAGGENHMKLAIADSSDSIYDSAVFLQAASLTSEKVVELTALEVTQAIQDLNNDVELIEDKPTYVRAHVRSATGTTIYNVKSKLIGYRDGSPLPGSPLAPQNLGGNIDVLGSPNRGLLNQSFYFRLPPSWTNGAVELEFVGLTHDIDCQEVASTDNDCKATVSFLDTPEMEVSLIGIRWEDSGGTVHDPGLADYEAIVQDIEAQHPIPALDWDRPYELTDWVSDGGPPDSDGTLSSWDLGDVNLELLNRRNLDGVTDRIYFGLLVDYPSGADLGLGYRPGWASSGFYRATDPTTFAHEVGHNLGRRHVNCSGGEGSPDGSYPYDDGHISQDNSGNDAYYGFHIFTRNIFGPSTGELMGYCRPRWISDYTYEAMRAEIVSNWGSSLLQPQAQILVAGDPAVLVAGFVEPDGSAGELESIYQISAPGPFSTPESGDYMLKFEDINGDELASYSIKPDMPEDTEEAKGIFSYLLPWEAGTAQIVFLYNGTELDTSNASANAPIVEITSPVTGTTWSEPMETISWTASDNDGDNLTFSVQYSADNGVSWQTLTTGATGTGYAVNRAVLPGTNQARLRVLASDGFHTAQDTSAVFTSTLNGPEALITDPLSGTLFVEDQLVFLTGTAYDPEDGTLSDGQLTWVSSLDGDLGSGQILTTNALSLTEGLHTISLQAMDSDFMSSTDAIKIQVLRDRPTLTPSLVVDTNGLSIQKMAGSPPTEEHVFAVDNEGDGTISWDITTNVPWINFSKSSGFTPDTVVMTVDVAGLTAGEYQGTVTITGADSLNSPQTVDVQLVVEGGLYLYYLPLVE